MSYRTPEQIEAFVKSVQYRLDGPSQWYGDEPNAYGYRSGGPKRWEDAKVTMCIFAQWTYEQAAGNQAIPLVYKTVNEYREDFLCDRSYLPSTPRDMRTFVDKGYPLFGIEHRHQLMDHDVVGTSISYPVLSINFIKQLMNSDILPTWDDRVDHKTGKIEPGRHRDPEKWPFVIVGGQVYGASEVVANIVDAVFCGEVEDEVNNPGFGAVMDRIADFKDLGLWSTDRMACYAELAKEFSFLYFPCFVDVHYGYEDRASVAEIVLGGKEVHPSKQVIGYTSRVPGMRLPIRKRFVKDMDSVAALTNPPLLYVEPGMGSGDAEVGRGCPAWCNFCALTYRQKPYRQRSVEYMTEMAKELHKNTGGVHIAPFSPDFPMHTKKKALIASLIENVTDDVDASSMRVDDFIADPSYILLQAHGGMDAVTLGVEGNSQRMRDLVGKGAADEDIKEAVARGIRAGLRKFKLYMIAALPGEDEGDIYRILNLGKQLADIRDSMGSNAQIQFSWTPMLIEGNTPFQWFAPTTINYALGDVWEELREVKIQFKMGGKSQKDKVVYFQLSQRASREVGKAMVEAVIDKGDACWGGAPRGLLEMMEERLVAHGFLNGVADSYDERQKNDMFGWEFIDQGINVELMWVTYQQMREFLEQTDSETYDLNFGDEYHGNEWIERCDTKCMGKTCGVCDVEDLKIRRNYIQDAVDELSVDLSNVKVIDQRSVAFKVRAKVVKDTDKRFVMNDHHRYALRRAANRSGLRHAKRTWKFASDNYKWKDWTCGVDFVEFGVSEKMNKAEVAKYMEAMNGELGSYLQIVDWMILPATADPLRQDIDLSLFEMEVDVDPNTALAAIDRWNATDYVKMVFKEETYQTGIDSVEVNGKDYVDDLWVVRDGYRVKIRMLTRGKANPYLVYQSLFDKKSWIEAAVYPAVRLEAFVEHEGSQIDFFRPTCDECGYGIPINALDKPYHYLYCPRCQDAAEGRLVEWEKIG